MTDRPILFSAPMVRALLAGTKTQTRRVCTWANNPASPALTYIVACDEPGWFGDEEGEVQFKAGFAPSDRLWVKETWACHWSTDDQKPSAIDPNWWSVRYFADDHIRPAARDGSLAPINQFKKKRVAIFMPRWASRLTLTVTDVRVERLQDISEADAIAEGTPCYVCGGPLDGSGEADCHCYHRKAMPIDYANLWNSINGPGAWDANPWVVAISFTVQQGNIDQAQA